MPAATSEDTRALTPADFAAIYAAASAARAAYDEFADYDCEADVSCYSGATPLTGPIHMALTPAKFHDAMGTVRAGEVGGLGECSEDDTDSEDGEMTEVEDDATDIEDGELTE